MDIQREEQLLPIIVRNKSILGKGLDCVAEVSSGFGIADLLFYSLKKEVVQRRISDKLPPISSYELIRTLTALNDVATYPVSLTFLKENLPAFRKQGAKVVTFLVERGFLIPTSKSSYCYKKGRAYSVGLQKVIAIEAKLSNWKRGLYQAYRYKEYASKSYLALYSKYIHRALKGKGEFVRFNVGLIEVGDEEIQVHIEPHTEKIKTNVFSALVYENILRSTENLFPNF